MTQNIRAHLALFSANLIYGINYSVAKDVMPDYILPFGFIFCRVVGALILFWGGYSLSYERIEKKDLLTLILCGFFGVCANQLMFFYGLNITTPINAGIIMTSNPIIVLIVSAVILKNKITPLKLGGITIGILGALLLLLIKKDLSFGSKTVIGDIFIFLNAMSYAIYLVIAAPLMKKYKPITVITWVFTFGALMVFPFGIEQFSTIDWETFSLKIWFEFIFVIVATTFLAYLLNIYGLKKMDPTVVSIYIYLQPLLASLVAISMGKDTLDWVKVLASVCIFTGVFMVSRKKQIN